jgi:hypothetical protein
MPQSSDMKSEQQQFYWHSEAGSNHAFMLGGSWWCHGGLLKPHDGESSPDLKCVIA